MKNALVVTVIVMANLVGVLYAVHTAVIDWPSAVIFLPVFAFVTSVLGVTAVELAVESLKERLHISER